jgi:hypothetical protein
MRRKLEALAAVLAAALTLAGIAAGASSPSVASGAASSIAQTSAVLGGIVNPNGGQTTYAFQWGLTNAYGVNGKPHSAGSGTKPVAASTTATGLIPGTRYHFRLIAISRSGVTVGADHTFSTAGHPPPGASTGPPAQVGTSFATVTGVVNPHGAATSWTIEYGTSTAYGVETFGGTVPAGSRPVIVASQLQGLASGSIFHYRLIARHGSTIVSAGSDAIFMTFPRSRPIPRIRARTGPDLVTHRPFVFTTAGRIALPPSIPAQFGCAGYVKIRFLFAGRRIGLDVVPLQPNCTFVAQTVFNHRPRRAGQAPAHVQVRVRFMGTGYLAPSNVRRGSVVMG